MKTIINDSFDLQLIECQFYDICAVYDPDRCGYSDKCQGYLTIEGNKKLKIRDLLRNSLEGFVAIETLTHQIKLIKEDGEKE